jgi:hypothetical protein
LDPSDSYFLFADLVGFYTHWTYIHIFRHIFLSNYWWQKSYMWSQASYRYPVSWEAFLDPSDSYFLFAEEWGYHKWALAHSSSCYISPSVRFSSDLVNANAHWGSTADDIYENENQRFYVTVCLKYYLNCELLLFALKINSACSKIIRLPVHSELAPTCSSINL